MPTPCKGWALGLRGLILIGLFEVSSSPHNSGVYFIEKLIQRLRQKILDALFQSEEPLADQFFNNLFRRQMLAKHADRGAGILEIPGQSRLLIQWPVLRPQRSKLAVLQLFISRLMRIRMRSIDGETGFYDMNCLIERNGSNPFCMCPAGLLGDTTASRGFYSAGSGDRSPKP